MAAYWLSPALNSLFSLKASRHCSGLPILSGSGKLYYYELAFHLAGSCALDFEGNFILIGNLMLLEGFDSNPSIGQDPF